MAQRDTRSESSEKTGRFPWGKVLGGIAGSAVASRVIRKMPLGRVLVAAAPLIIAAIQKNKADRTR